MQQTSDPYVCGINARSESILISIGHIYFSRNKHVPVDFWFTYFTRKVNLTIRETFQSSNLYDNRRNA